MPRAQTIILVAATGLVLAACGSSSPRSTNASASNRNAGLEFASCMRSHGVSNFPDPGSNGNGGIQVQSSQRAGSGPSLSVDGVSVNAPEFQSAMQACRSKLPNGGHPSAAQTARAKAQALAMSKCMRAHGVPNFPDPTFQSGPGGAIGIRIGGPGSGIDPSSPAFQAAQKICLPAGGFRLTAKAAP
jgi:hypothetical protein